MIGDTLPIDTSNFSLKELRAALGKMRTGKAAGPDVIPPDFWKLLANGNEARVVLSRACQECWESEYIPTQWRNANVSLRSEKGGATLPNNYRPISALAVWHNVLAAMIHRRLRQGGSERIALLSKFSLGIGRGTADALMLVRRARGAAHASKNDGA